MEPERQVFSGKARVGLLVVFGLAVSYHLYTYLPHITDYPFSLWWSETTRFYMASSFFDLRIYGVDLPWVFRDLTRYLIQAVPFLWEDSPIWLHRLWQVILRFGSGYLVGYVLGHRLQIKPKWILALFTAWVGLYLFQGPLFYNLVPIVLLAFGLADPRRFWRTLLVVLAASIYAGFSRVNWVPMAGLLAALFYFLEQPVSGGKWQDVFRYLLPPAVWVILGSVLGMGAQQFWQQNSGNPPEMIYSSFTSYLLYDRLLPNPSYRLGILLATLIVSGPLLIYLVRSLRGWRQTWHPIRVLAVAVILGGLAAGGLLVSIKIGGGTNLHNMDVFLVALLVVGVELYFGRAADENGQPVWAGMPVWLKAAVLVMPLLFLMTFLGRTIKPLDRAQADEDLATLQTYASQAVAEGGEVLFMSQRHLLTFGYIQGVPLVHAHEKLLLQEMVMSKNEVYLASFGEEMARQRYALIVLDPLPLYWKNPNTTPLAMENNVLNKHLVPLILCAYEVRDSLLDGALDVMVPKAEPTCQQDKE